MGSPDGYRRPDEVVSMLNGYFEAMVEEVFADEGTLDKFIGDCVMAIFGAPLDQTDHAARALRVARAIQRRVEVLSSAETSAGEMEIRVGVGINTGYAVAGFIGSAQALEYTVIGDTVNVASRLCDKAGGGDILIGPRTHELAGGIVRFEPTEPLALKGKAMPLQCFRVAGDA